MGKKPVTKDELLRENRRLRQRLKKAEENLIAYRENQTGHVTSQKLARLFLEHSTEVIIISDGNGKISQANQLAHLFFPGKLLGRPFDAVCPFTLTSSLPSEVKRFSFLRCWQARFSVRWRSPTQERTKYFILS